MTLPVSPTSGVIDENNVLTLNWNPPLVSGAYSAYDHWDIWYAPLPAGTPELLLASTTGMDTSAGGTLDSRAFTIPLTAGEYEISMNAVDGSNTTTPWDSYHAFPPALSASQITPDRLTAQINEPITFTLDGAYSGVSSWRMVFSDGTTTGWLSTAVRSVIKSFTVAGNQNITVESQNLFENANPAVQLKRRCTVSVFIMNQVFNAGPGASTSETLGFGGEQGFEISTISTETVQPYAVIVKALVRDTVTNELKLLILTSRSSDASSILGTLAADVFPLVGRPHIKQLVELPTLTTTSSSSLIPVQIITTTLPSPVAGQPMAEFQMQVQNGSGTPPYIWYALNLPFGIKLSTNGTLSGIPSSYGTYLVDFVVKDSSNPEFIATTTLPLVVQTDLSILTTSVPNAEVAVPYQTAIQLQGGMPPFTWSIVSGQFPRGLSVSDAGNLEGYPCSYSNSDFTSPFTATVQVTDASGATASAVFTMNLTPAPLNMGDIDQQVYIGQEFRLGVPVYGGYPPYTLVSCNDEGYIQSPKLIDGRVEFLFPASLPSGVTTGTHNIVFTISDSNGNSQSFTRSYTIADTITPVHLEYSVFDHIWSSSGDTTSLPNAVVGEEGGLVLQNISPITVPNGLVVSEGKGSVYQEHHTVPAGSPYTVVPLAWSADSSDLGVNFQITESGTIPTSSPYSITVAKASAYYQNISVTYSSGLKAGQTLTKV